MLPTLASAIGFGTAAKVGAGVAAAFSGAQLIKGVKSLVPQIKQPPGAPTIDQAAIAIQQSDRLRQRRGVYANIFGGAAKSTLG